MNTCKKSAAGFTLIELMITVTIVGLLGAVAYPAYMDSVRKGRRAQGRAAIAQLLQQQERYITQRNCYLPFITAATGVATATTRLLTGACEGLAPTPFPFKVFSGDTLASSHYLLHAEVCPRAENNVPLSIQDCILVVASPRKADPAVGILRMTSTGQKSCDGNTQRLCWP